MSGTRSIWFDTASLPKHRAIAKSTHVDVCVVGAGIAGLGTRSPQESRVVRRRIS